MTTTAKLMTAEKETRSKEKGWLVEVEVVAVAAEEESDQVVALSWGVVATAAAPTRAPAALVAKQRSNESAKQRAKDPQS